MLTKKAPATKDTQTTKNSAAPCSSHGSSHGSSHACTSSSNSPKLASVPVSSSSACAVQKKEAHLPTKAAGTALVKEEAKQPISNRKPAIKTTLIVHYDAGFPNQLHIRGSGAGLQWEKGEPLKNVKADEWIWETSQAFESCEFKILINDELYETGENHKLQAGKTLLITPCF